MANRRVGRATRGLKKKAKASKKASLQRAGSAAGGAGTKRLKLAVKARPSKRGTGIDSLKRQKSQLAKRQVAEKMVLKEHIRELESKRARIRRGENASTERRELGKYIRRLKEEQLKRHGDDLLDIEKQIQEVVARRREKAKAGNNEDDEWEDTDDDAVYDEDELQNMFAHLTA